MFKSKSVITLITFLALFSTQIQSQWFQQNSGINTQLFSISFISADIGFAAGDSGKVLRTTNAGLSWTANTVLNTSVSYRSICFVNPSTGYIAGRILILMPTLIAKPIIIKTTNAGITWNSVINDSGYTLYSTSFIDVNTGFAVGGLYASGPNKLLKTINGGISWTDTTFASGYFRSVNCVNSNTIYLSTGTGDIFKTQDAGSNWSITFTFPGNVISSISFLNTNTGFITGGANNNADSSGRIIKTTNGGSIMGYSIHRP